MFSAGDFINFIEGRLERGNPDFVINRISTDTRSLEEGDFFVPLCGENFDGHNFIEKALQKGACGFITSREDYLNLKADLIISVRDPMRAYQRLARFHREKFDIPVIAVTGSNGKTTTKELLFTLLSQKFNCILKSRENFNNEIGVSRTLLELSEKHDCAVLEFAMRGSGEIALLSDIALPSTGIITNIGEAHIGRLGSRREIAKAKAELIERLPSGGLAVLNRDNDWFDFITGKVSCKNILSFGFSPKADIYASNINEQSMEGTQLDIHFNHRSERVFFPLVGRHNIYNLLGAVAVTSHLIKDAALSPALKSFIPPPAGRTRIIRNKNDIIVIDDTYNSNPLAVKSIIETMAGYFPGHRKIAVLGDMLELGSMEVALHSQVGEWVSEYGIDYLFTYGSLSRHTHKAALIGGTKSLAFDEKLEIVEKLQNILEPGDVLLIKGSRRMHMEEILGYFLDRDK